MAPVRALLVAVAAGVAGAAAPGPISWDQAKCIMEGEELKALGDSNTRYWFFTFNYFLNTGELRPADQSCSYDKWGCEGEDYNDGEEGTKWTESWGRSSDGTHMMHLNMDFDDIDAKTSFWFIQTTWFDDDETSKPNMEDIVDDIGSDKIIIFNSGWWDLKPWGEDDRGYDECGDDFEDECEDAYRADLEKVVEELFEPSKAALFRSSSCCGDDPEWYQEVEKFNEIAESVMDDKGYSYVEVFDLYGPSEREDATEDGTHALPEYYHQWTVRILQDLDKQLGKNCLSGGGGGGGSDSGSDSEDEDEVEYQPTYKPTPKPNYEPTYQPTSSECEDSDSWYYKGKNKKDCEWAGDKGKCKKKDPEGVKAEDACPKSCGTC